MFSKHIYLLCIMIVSSEELVNRAKGIFLEMKMGVNLGIFGK